MAKVIQQINPGEFEAEDCFYPKVQNAQLHPLVSYFFNLSHEQIIERYTHLNPQVQPAALRAILKNRNTHFHWGGADLFYVTTENGNRRMVILETNSCPSGQKSMPQRTDTDEHRGYRLLLEKSFLPLLKKKRLPQGALAVIYDKNAMEAKGYAATLAELTNETVYLVTLYNDNDQHIKFEDGVMTITLDNGETVTIRAAFRYVTQKPWNRLPVVTKTLIYNSPLVCLAGGRNKLVANKAYQLYNSDIQDSGLKINMPETVRDISKLEVPLWVRQFGGYAVIKNPYSNAGQGVYTITNEAELDNFMNEDHEYDQFIVQSLIGHYDWSSKSESGKFFHIGTVPNKKNNIYVADLRVMVFSSPEGMFPCAIYARRARKPLNAKIDAQMSSWDILGTNLSIKVGENKWESDTSRLMLMDQKDFNMLGIGIDDLIEAYIQSVLSVIAIDKMSQNLIGKKGQFKAKLFRSLDNDAALMNEILI